MHHKDQITTIPAMGHAVGTGNRPLNDPPGYNPMQGTHSGSMLETSVNENNELLIVTAPLVTLVTQIRHTVEQHNVIALRAQVVEEVKQCEQKLRSIGYSDRITVATRYCLCTAIDEAVLSRHWGIQSVWVQQSLLSLFQRETWGGERFFIILEDMLRDLRKNIDFIELIYFLLSLGFEGKFHGAGNRATREEIRNRILYRIRQARSKPERSLSRYWRLERLPSSNKERKSKLKRIGLATLILIAILAGFYNMRAQQAASTTLARLNQIATEAPITNFSQIIQRPIVLRSQQNG